MRLARADPVIAARAEAIARDLPGSIDSEDIADTLCRELSALRIEDVRDTSGRTRYGYIHPSKRADEMLDEVIDSYKEEMSDLSPARHARRVACILCRHTPWDQGVPAPLRIGTQGRNT